MARDAASSSWRWCDFGEESLGCLLEVLVGGDQLRGLCQSVQDGEVVGSYLLDLSADGLVFEVSCVCCGGMLTELDASHGELEGKGDHLQLWCSCLRG